MILYGASGHGKVIHSICPQDVSMFIDDNSELKTFCGKPVFQVENIPNRSELTLVSIGNNRIRELVVDKLNFAFGIVVSRTAEIDESVIIHEGTQVIHRALIQADVTIGKHCIINSMSSIDHDCKIADFVHIAPNSTLCGNVNVGEGSLIGAGAVVIPGISIGKWAVVAAGSVVTEDVPDFALVAGNPSKIKKLYDPR